MCILFITVDLGYPTRILNVMLYPTPNSILFWDMIVLNGYLFLNLFIGWDILTAERKAVGMAQVGQTSHLYFHPLGGQHPYGHGLPLRRSSGSPFLAYGHHGRPLFGLGLCRRPGPVDHSGPVGQTVNEI